MYHFEIFQNNDWESYQLIDCGDYERLEKWGNYYFIRPDPQAIWPKDESEKLWHKADAKYNRSTSGGGSWNFKSTIPEHWVISYKKYNFRIKPTNFKHMGLFPEQATNWDFINKNTKKGDKVLNLFAYSGGATVAAAEAGAIVTHIDASKGMLSWCKENLNLSNLSEANVRLIPDDCQKFVLKEIRRSAKYDALIMDPPSFGRGGKGEIWKFEENIGNLLEETKKILTNKPKYLIINIYTTGISAIAINNLIKSIKLPFDNIVFGEITLPFRNDNMLLPCGVCLRLYN